jgi:hypothetical protein
MRLLYQLALSTAAFFLAGCASGVYKVDWGDISNGSKICIVKNNEFLGCAIASGIFVDDKRVADLKVGEWFCTTVPSGVHTLQMEYTTLAFSYLPDQTYYYFIGNSLEGLRGKSVDGNFFKKLTTSHGYEDISGKEL